MPLKFRNLFWNRAKQFKATEQKANVTVFGFSHASTFIVILFLVVALRQQTEAAESTSSLNATLLELRSRIVEAALEKEIALAKDPGWAVCIETNGQQSKTSIVARANLQLGGWFMASSDSSGTETPYFITDAIYNRRLAERSAIAIVRLSLKRLSGALVLLDHRKTNFTVGEILNSMSNAVYFYKPDTNMFVPYITADAKTSSHSIVIPVNMERRCDLLWKLLHSEIKEFSIVTMIDEAMHIDYLAADSQPPLLRFRDPDTLSPHLSYTNNVLRAKVFIGSQKARAKE